MQDPRTRDEARGARRYADLEVRVDRADQGNYPVRLVLNGEQEFPRGLMDGRVAQWVTSGDPRQDGEDLFRLLLSDAPVAAAWNQVRGQFPCRAIRLNLDEQAPELAPLPWESLREPGNEALAASVETPFSRYITGPWKPGDPVVERPIRILAVIADPDFASSRFGLEPVDAEAEWALLNEATEAVREAGKVELVRLPRPCTLTALMEHLQKGFHILHFVGHGRYSEKIQDSALFMADQDNQVARVQGQELAEMIARQALGTDDPKTATLRLIFLGSCHSASRSPRAAFAGLALRLMAKGVPAVLAMQDRVAVRTERELARVFYGQLLRHGRVDRAVNEARAAVLTAGLPDASVPALYMRLRTGNLLARLGRISSGSEGQFWPYLLQSIYDAECVPFVGPRATAGLLPTPEEIAQALAAQFNCPLPNSDDLARVASFVAATDEQSARRAYLELLRRGFLAKRGATPTAGGGRRRRRAAGGVSLSDAIKEQGWAKETLELVEDEPHHLLADLELPLYMTTNIDNFLFEALRVRGQAQDPPIVPRREAPRWDSPEASDEHWVLSSPPNEDNPVVFHLNGHDGDKLQRKHMVLTERDHLRQLVRVCRGADRLMPANVYGRLPGRSFLFLGYGLYDREFQLLLEGLMPLLAQGSDAGRIRVGVQVEQQGVVSEQDVQRYLGDYLRQRFKLDIYWGDVRQFSAELHARWQRYLREQDASF